MVTSAPTCYFTDEVIRQTFVLDCLHNAPAASKLGVSVFEGARGVPEGVGKSPTRVRDVLISAKGCRRRTSWLP